MVAAQLALAAFAVGVSETLAACSSAGDWKKRSPLTCEQIEVKGSVPKLRMIDGKPYCMVARIDSLCIDSITYDEAKQQCADIDMRLCRTDEPIVDGGCLAEEQRAWYETPCSGGHWVAGQANGELDNPVCTADSDTAYLVCCADKEETTEPECEECPSNAYSTGDEYAGQSSCTCRFGYSEVFYGSSNPSGLLRCSANDEVDLTSCSADKFATRSEKNCNTLSNNNGFKNEDDFCVGMKQSDGECPPTSDISFRDADMYCAKAGARLCSLAEISENNVLSRVSGCSDPTTRSIWTSTPCTNSGSEFFLYEGSNSPPYRCVSKTSTRSSTTIACCGDDGNNPVCSPCSLEGATAPAGSTSEEECTCEARAQDGTCEGGSTPIDPTEPGEVETCRADHYLTPVSVSKVPRQMGLMRGRRWAHGYTPKEDGSGDCPAARGKGSSETYCESRGARLCTEAELLSGTTRGSGCGFDRQYVWSSTPCCTGKGSCDDQHFYAVSGYGKGRGGPERWKSQPRKICEQRSNNHFPRCCKDAHEEPYCSRCPRYSTSAANSEGVTSCSCRNGYWGADGGECYPN